MTIQKAERVEECTEMGESHRQVILFGPATLNSSRNQSNLGKGTKGQDYCSSDWNHSDMEERGHCCPTPQDLEP